MFQRKEQKSVSNSPSLLQKIPLEELIKTIMEKNRTPEISESAWQFAREILENSCLTTLRTDNFCIDLTKPKTRNNVINLESWSKEQYKAFAKLYSLFTHEAQKLLLQKQEQGKSTAHETQVLWLKLPKQNDLNRKAVNGISKTLLNHGYEDRSGNESWISLQKYINTKKSNPISSYSRTNQSVSLVIVTENQRVLLLKRGGQSGRAGNWGTLTGNIEWNETKEKAIAREVHEEINFLLENKKVFYVGAFHTPNLSKDLAEKGKVVSYADDCSHVYGIRINEEELLKAIKLDSENSAWKLFSEDELRTQFEVHNSAIHGNDFDKKEFHVAIAKSLLVLGHSKNDFNTIEYGKFNYPYTNSPGFFAGRKDEKASQKQFFPPLSEVTLSYEDSHLNKISITLDNMQKSFHFTDQEEMRLLAKVLIGKMSPNEGFGYFMENLGVCGTDCSSQPMTLVLRHGLSNARERNSFVKESLYQDLHSFLNQPTNKYNFVL